MERIWYGFRILTLLFMSTAVLAASLLVISTEDSFAGTINDFKNIGGNVFEDLKNLTSGDNGLGGLTSKDINDFYNSKGAEDEEPKRLEADGKLTGILLLHSITHGVQMQKLGEMIDAYYKNYVKDHNVLLSKDLVDPKANPYRTISADIVGYRGVPSSPDIYSSIYPARENAFRDTVRGVAKDNAEESSQIRGQVQEWINKMNKASDGAEGYVQAVQAGTQEANYLNLELVQLRADTLRQIDIQMLAAIEEAQDDFDETSAFEGAVSTWKSPGPVSGY